MKERTLRFNFLMLELNRHNSNCRYHMNKCLGKISRFPLSPSLWQSIQMHSYQSVLRCEASSEVCTVHC